MHYNSIVESLQQKQQKKGAAGEEEEEEEEEELPDSIWDEWLWHTDALEECHMDLMMNRMHLMGLLIARYRSCKQVRFSRSNASLRQIYEKNSSNSSSQGTEKNDKLLLWLFDTPVRNYSLRQLMDTLLNMQARSLSHENMFVID